MALVAGKSFRMNSQEDVQELMQTIVTQIQLKFKNELKLKEVFIPKSKAEAKCNIFVSPNYAACQRLVIFLQPGEGMQPGIWSRSLHPKTGFQGSMIPYLKTALQRGFGVMVLNPSTNVANVNGHRAKILHSGSPEEHLDHIWKHYISTSSATEVSFIAYSDAGKLLKRFLSTLKSKEATRVGGIVFIESTHTIDSSERSTVRRLLEDKSVNFEASRQPMFSSIPSSQSRLGCASLSIGNNTAAGDSREWTVHSVQTSAFVFLQSVHEGLPTALQSVRATFPNKLVATVHRARLTGEPYRNPHAVVTCVGQKKETVGNHKRTMDPEWNQTFSFPVTDSEESVSVSVKDHRGLGFTSTIGQVLLRMGDVGLNRADRRWFTLQDDKVSTPFGMGEIEMTLEWVHDTFVARSDTVIKGHRGFDANESAISASGSSYGNSSTDASKCYMCSQAFGLRRRHHCRMCLQPVCANCSDRLFLPGFSEPKRVCSGCCELQMRLHNSSPPAGRKTPKGNKNVSREEAAKHEERLEAMRQREQAAQRPLTIDDFELLKVVGRGAFGKVLLVKKKHGKGKGEIYAMKILVKAHIVKNDQIENTKAEQHILKEIDHPYVVRLRYAFQNAEKLYLIMDYYPGGSMYHHLKLSKRFTEDRTRLYMAQLLTALMHLHEKQIAYRDLKLENILMDPKGHIALTDFGLSKEGQFIQGGIRASQADNGMKTICGTAEYMAPELLRHQPYGKVVDWWSYGILLFEMLTGRTPFVDRNRRQMFKNIMQSEVIYPSHISSDARSLISQLLNRDPEKRLGSGPTGGKEIMAHPFFQEIDWDKLLRKEITPPFIPTVGGAEDMTNVPEMFQNMQAVDSPVSKKNGEGHHFDDFTYQGEAPVGRD